MRSSTSKKSVDLTCLTAYNDCNKGEKPMTFDDDIYEDHTLVWWTENISRETLELEFLQLVSRYRRKTREIQKMKKEASDSSWERTMRQQERSGGWM